MTNHDHLLVETPEPNLVSILHAPHIRLRIDYRRLGRAAASYLLHGTTPAAVRATLVNPE